MAICLYIFYNDLYFVSNSTFSWDMSCFWLTARWRCFIAKKNYSIFVQRSFSSVSKSCISWGLNPPPEYCWEEPSPEDYLKWGLGLAVFTFFFDVWACIWYLLLWILRSSICSCSIWTCSFSLRFTICCSILFSFARTSSFRSSVS